MHDVFRFLLGRNLSWKVEDTYKKLNKKSIPIGEKVTLYQWIWGHLADEISELNEWAKQLYKEKKDKVFLLPYHKGFFKVIKVGPVTSTDWAYEQMPITYQRIGYEPKSDEKLEMLVMERNRVINPSNVYH